MGGAGRWASMYPPALATVTAPECQELNLRFRGMSTPHPWRWLRQLAHIKLSWHDGGPRGKCRHSTQEISLRNGMTQAERRSALAHELAHLLSGPAIIGHVERDERQVTAQAARWLIPLDCLVEAMLWANDDYELADELWVDVFTVRARLAYLTPLESAELERRMLMAERQFTVEVESG